MATSISFDSAIEDIAKSCSMARIMSKNRPGGCTDYVGGKYCVDCPDYIGKYINADPRHIELYMRKSDNNLRAELARMNTSKKVQSTGTGIIVAIVLVIVALFANLIING